MRIVEGPAGLRAIVGQELGVSDWVTFDQPRIYRFADATDDDYWSHVDPERARSSAIGSTIAHGLGVLSLGPPLLYRVVTFEGFAQMFLYGYEHVRFPAPVPVDSRVRLIARLAGVTEKSRGDLAHLELRFDLEGSDRPACLADYLLFLASR